MKQGLSQKAKDFAYKMHKGQKRKGGLPYITHPKGVVKILEEIGINDEVTISAAWLHDTLEDTVTKYEDLEKEFGKNIADMVYNLTRNVDRESYKSRIKTSGYLVKVIKLADTLHNVHNPYLMRYLSDEGVKKKIGDCIEFYIPLAMQICPSIGYKLKESISNYLKIFRR